LIGDQKIVFGTAYSEEEVKEKFKRLKIFYKEAIPYEGWAKYNEISVKYDGQIVCRKRGE
jgi:cell division protein FtsQ